MRLTVTDDSGSADTVTQTVAIVGNEIQPPVASLVATPDTAREGAGIGFDASGSQAPGSTIGSYAWRFGDGKSRIGELTSHVYPHAGTYTVTLTIITANALTDTTTRKVHTSSGAGRMHRFRSRRGTRVAANSSPSWEPPRIPRRSSPTDGLSATAPTVRVHSRGTATVAGAATT